jgi:hypothetical protein
MRSLDVKSLDLVPQISAVFPWKNYDKQCDLVLHMKGFGENLRRQIGEGMAGLSESGRYGWCWKLALSFSQGSKPVKQNFGDTSFGTLIA